MKIVINRRAAFRTFASVAALIGPSGHIDVGEDHPDIELFALARQARERNAVSRRAFDSAEALETQFEAPTIPQALIVTPQDAHDFGPLMAKVGKSFRQADVVTLAALRDALLAFASVAPVGFELPPKTARAVERIAEVEIVSKAYHERKCAAWKAFGIPAADAKAESLLADEIQALHALAFKPAKTVAGVLAKLAAVAPQCRVRDPSRSSDRCDDSTVLVLEMSALDLVALKVEA